MKKNKFYQSYRQRGLSAIMYVVASAILMIALTAALSIGGSDSANNIEINSLVNRLRGSANIMTLQLNKCMTTYPGVTNGSAVGTYFTNYPAHDLPSTLSATPASYGSFATFKNIECPGARQLLCSGMGSGLTCRAARIWSFSSNDAEHPLPPAGFSDWQYQNHPQWVGIRTTTSAGGWQLKALRRLGEGTNGTSVKVCDASTPPYALFVVNFHDDGGGISEIADIPCQ